MSGVRLSASPNRRSFDSLCFATVAQDDILIMEPKKSSCLWVEEFTQPKTLSS